MGQVFRAVSPSSQGATGNQLWGVIGVHGLRSPVPPWSRGSGQGSSCVFGSR